MGVLGGKGGIVSQFLTGGATGRGAKRRFAGGKTEDRGQRTGGDAGIEVCQAELGGEAFPSGAWERQGGRQGEDDRGRGLGCVESIWRGAGWFVKMRGKLNLAQTSAHENRAQMSA